MSAAYELREHDVVVLEALDRVGGRTLSGQHGDYWYNLGAQFVWDDRTLDLCQRLGVETLGAHSAKAALFLDGSLVSASSPYELMLRLPVSLRDKLDLGRTIARLRWRNHRLTPAHQDSADRQSLGELVGATRPLTRRILDEICSSGTGLPMAEVSAWIGLGYVIHLFGGRVHETLKGVRGGTQRLAESISDAVDSERVMLGARVETVQLDRDGVVIQYRRHGRPEQLRARSCIVALPADAVLEVVKGLPSQKREALERMTPYARIVSIAWLTNETKAMPWDDCLSIPIIDDMSFEFFSNSAFFSRQTSRDRLAGGTFVTLATGSRADRLWHLDDDTVRLRVLEDLKRVFPTAAAVFDEAVARMYRWHGLPLFHKGWLADRAALREPLGSIHFCGDYTAQPGTPGAVGSGFHAARALLPTLI
jgi:oxygen-dependent protoporphyrinogen oxidase